MAKKFISFRLLLSSARGYKVLNDTLNCAKKLRDIHCSFCPSESESLYNFLCPYLFEFLPRTYNKKDVQLALQGIIVVDHWKGYM